MRQIGAIVLSLLYLSINLIYSQTISYRETQPSQRHPPFLTVPAVPVLESSRQSGSSSTTIELPAVVYSTPPAAPARNIAEFETSEAVLIAYPNSGFGIPVEMIKDMADQGIIYCIASNTTNAENAMKQGGVNMDKVKLFQITIDSYWTRDYGPWCIIDGNGKIGFIDFTYNRIYGGANRVNDDKATQPFGDKVGTAVYMMKAVTAGGDYMCDGYGIGASTDLVIRESQQYEKIPQETVIQNHKNFLGLSNFITVPDPLTTSTIDHIDCWGKFLAPDKILIKKSSSSGAEATKLDEAADFWSKQISSYGTPYKVYRVVGSGSEPYTNSFIFNKTVYVPFSGNSTDDEAAKKAYETAMPGYSIKGIKAGSAAWQGTDAIHCRTHEIADKEMLFIKHIPLHGTIEDNGSGMSVEATVIPYSKKPLKSAESVVFYKLKKESAYKSVPLEVVAETKYKALIPSFHQSDSVAYYITAADESGRQQNHPFIGAADAHTFYCRFSSTAMNTNAGSLQTTLRCWSSFDPLTDGIRIAWYIPVLAQNTSLTMYSLNGKRIKTWHITAAHSSLLWDRRSESGSKVAPGVYLYTLRNNHEVISHPVQIVQ